MSQAGSVGNGGPARTTALRMADPHANDLPDTDLVHGVTLPNLTDTIADPEEMKREFTKQQTLGLNFTGLPSLKNHSELESSVGVVMAHRVVGGGGQNASEEPMRMETLIKLHQEPEQTAPGYDDVESDNVAAERICLMTGVHRGLSLGHEFYEEVMNDSGKYLASAKGQRGVAIVKKPLEVSLCGRGQRPGSVILNYFPSRRSLLRSTEEAVRKFCDIYKHTPPPAELRRAQKERWCSYIDNLCGEVTARRKRLLAESGYADSLRSRGIVAASADGTSFSLSSNSGDSDSTLAPLTLNKLDWTFYDFGAESQRSAAAAASASFSQSKLDTASAEENATEAAAKTTPTSTTTMSSGTHNASANIAPPQQQQSQPSATTSSTSAAPMALDQNSSGAASQKQELASTKFGLGSAAPQELNANAGSGQQQQTVDLLLNNQRATSSLTPQETNTDALSLLQKATEYNRQIEKERDELRSELEAEKKRKHEETQAAEKKAFDERKARIAAALNLVTEKELAATGQSQDYTDFSAATRADLDAATTVTELEKIERRVKPAMSSFYRASESFKAHNDQMMRMQAAQNANRFNNMHDYWANTFSTKPLGAMQVSGGGATNIKRESDAVSGVVNPGATPAAATGRHLASENAAGNVATAFFEIKQEGGGMQTDAAAPAAGPLTPAQAIDAHFDATGRIPTMYDLQYGGIRRKEKVQMSSTGHQQTVIVEEHALTEPFAETFYWKNTFPEAWSLYMQAVESGLKEGGRPATKDLQASYDLGKPYMENTNNLLPLTSFTAEERAAIAATPFV